MTVRVPCQGRNPCGVPGCPCAVNRFGPRATRVRVCECCARRLHGNELEIFRKQLKTSPVVRAILVVLAGELRLEKEDQDAAAAAEGAKSPFLEELPPEVREVVRKRITGAA